MKSTHVPGNETHEILLYALSTCVWCAKTKRLLNQLGLAYDYVDMDLLPIEEQEVVSGEIEKWRDEVSFPTLVIDGRFCITGYRPEEISALAPPA